MDAPLMVYPNSDLLIAVNVHMGTVLNIQDAMLVSGRIRYKIAYNGELGWVNGGLWPQERFNNTNTASELAENTESTNNWRWRVVLANPATEISLVHHRGIPGTSTEPVPFQDRYFTQHNLREGTIMSAHGANRGLRHGAWVEIKNPNNPRIIDGLVEIERNWGLGVGRSIADDGVMDYNTLSREALAQEILNRYIGSSTTGQFIDLRGWGTLMTNANRRSVYMNLVDTANGDMATTRPEMQNVYLAENLLIAILRINDTFGTITINAIAGGDHTGRPNDEHFLGVAADFQANPDYFLERATLPDFIRPEDSNRNVRYEDVLQYLEETWGFMTQRNSGGQARDSTYYGNPRAFHLEIWGRNS